MGEPSALCADGVLRDLTEHGLTGPDHLFDALVVVLGRAVDVVGVKGDVALIEDGVLGNANVDEGQLHARQDVLDSPDVDVAVDLVGLVGVLSQRVLNHRAALERGDVGAVRRRVHGHEVTTLGAGATLSPTATTRLAATGAVAGFGGRRLHGRFDVATRGAIGGGVSGFATLAVLAIALAAATATAATATALTRCRGSARARRAHSGPELELRDECRLFVGLVGCHQFLD